MLLCLSMASALGGGLYEHQEALLGRGRRDTWRGLIPVLRGTHREDVGPLLSILAAIE
jgi:hypothetical protein